ncbi:hypothetical protein HDU85_006375 [Gaertneriomyces sp. JEL0708]|nr:hypothetical protein HDU85_006375 [Gaertneriomyces sp. JEL0708]
MDDKGKAQTDELATLVEDRLSYTFPAGRNPNVKCIRLTLDPVQAAHRPLIYYAVVIAINRFAHQMIRRLGFRQRTLDPLDVAGTGTLRYLYRSPSEAMPPGSMPVVFIHGIGIGLGAYLPFLMKLPRNVPVYLLEWPHVSMQLSEEVPSIPDTLAFLSSMLNRDGHPKATFVAHSLGTVAVSWMLRSRLHRNRVGAAVLLDPVTFLLHDPSVAFNFLYRPPHTVLELLMSYFVSREMYIAHSLSRHFHWSKNVLFFEDLPAKGKNVVVLSENDAIVPAPRVKAYLENKLRMAAVLGEGSDSENEELPETKGVTDEQPITKARNLRVHYYPGRQHGEMLVRPSMLATLEQEVLIACGADKPATDPLEDAVVVEEEPKASVTVHRRRSTHLAKLKIAPSKQYKPAWKVKMAKGADESPRIMVVRSSVGRV